MTFRTLDEIGTGRRVLVRLDLNSPVRDGVVQDNRRFARHAETVRELLTDDHAVVCLAHQGRPGRDDFTSLRQHADVLAEHVGQEVAFVDDVYGTCALEAVRDLEGGEVLLLENVRMTEDELPERPPEEHAGSEFVRTLAPEFDCYVDDAYSVAHRSHASIVGFPLVLESYAGRVMASEYEANTAIANRDFDGEVTMICGGTKAKDVVDVMNGIDDRVDNFLLGGVAGELFLRADSYDVGYDVGDTTIYDEQWERTHETVTELLEGHREQIELARDLAYEDDDGERAEIAVEAVEGKERSFLDVGHDTVACFADVIEESAAVFVKGALGVFEDERFSYGTVGVLEAIAASDCFSVVGGGDTSRAIGMYGLSERDFSHVSIAGGAYIRSLTDEELVGVEVLRTD